MAKKTETKKIKVTLIKSVSGRLAKQQKTIQALGLSKIGQTVEHNDNPAIRGMIFVVKHMVTVSE